MKWILLLIGLILWIGTASAADYYVNTSGNDGNQGNITHPWRTITYAATQAAAGDTVHIEGGNYGHEHVVISNSGTSGNLITFQGYSGEVIIDGADDTGYGIYMNSKSYIKIEGFNITNYQFGILGHLAVYNITINDSVVYSNYKGIAFQGTGTNNTIQNCTAYNNEMTSFELHGCTNSIIEDCWSYNKNGLGSYTDYAYALTYSSTDNIIRDCIAGQLAADGGYHIGHGFALRHSSSNNQIIHCTSYYMNNEHYKTSQNSDSNSFYNCTGSGQYAPYYVNGFRIMSSNNTIENCYIEGTDYGVSVRYHSSEPSTQPIQGNVFKNCVVVNNLDGISFYNYGEATPPDNNTIKNCIIAYNLDDGIIIAAGVTNSVNQYNDVWNNVDDYDGCSAGTGDISSDPLFVDYSNYDYHLKSVHGHWNGAAWINDGATSPCIDAGNPADSYSNEPAGNGARINIGFYGNTVEASKSSGGPVTYNINGTATYSSSPVCGVETSDNASVDSDTTDASGNYNMSGYVNGTYNISFTKPGYTISYLEVTINGVDNNSADITLSLVPPPSSYDNIIKSNNPEAVYNNTPNLDVGQVLTMNQYKSLFWYDLSGYNKSDIINDAKFNVTWFFNHLYRNKSTVVSIYLVNVTTDGDYISYNYSSNGVQWTIPGGTWIDTDGTAMGTNAFATVTIPNTAPDHAVYSFDVTTLIQSIVNGSLSNNAFIIVANETNTNYIAFAALENETVADRPKLDISHELGPPTTFINPTLGNDSTTNNNYVEVNASIEPTTPLTSFIWNWNGTNTTLYNNSLVLYLQMDNNTAIGDSSTVVVDVSQHGNNGSFTDGVTGNWTENGMDNGGWVGDGSDHINCGHDSSLNLTNLTMEIDFRRNSFGSIQGLVGKGNIASNNDLSYTIYFDSSNILTFNVGNNTAYQLLTGPTITDSDNHSVKVTADSTTLFMYIDGVIYSTPQTVIPYASPGDLIVGGLTTTSYRFNGTLDNAKLYDYAFSYDNINQSNSSYLEKYNSTHWFFFTNQTDLSDGIYNYQTFANGLESDYRIVTVDINASIIIIPANSLGMFNNWTATNFSNIGSNEINGVCYSYYNVTTGVWESYYVGYSWNADYVIPTEASVSGFFSTQTTIVANMVTPSNTNLSTGWNMLFLMGTDNETINDIKADIGVNCTAVWAYNSSAGAYTNTSSYTLLPCEGFLAYLTQNMTPWVRSDL